MALHQPNLVGEALRRGFSAALSCRGVNPPATTGAPSPAETTSIEGRP